MYLVPTVFCIQLADNHILWLSNCCCFFCVTTSHTTNHREIVLLPWWSMLLLILKVNLMIVKTSRPNRSPRTSLNITSLVPISLTLPEARQDAALWLWQSPAIPIFFMITNFSQNLVPTPAFMKLATAFGFNCSMDQFVGRQKSAWTGNDRENTFEKIQIHRPA